jgi:hypothetical protein
MPARRAAGLRHRWIFEGSRCAPVAVGNTSAAASVPLRACQSRLATCPGGTDRSRSGAKSPRPLAGRSDICCRRLRRGRRRASPPGGLLRLRLHVVRGVARLDGRARLAGLRSVTSRLPRLGRVRLLTCAESCKLAARSKRKYHPAAVTVPPCVPLGHYCTKCKTRLAGLSGLTKRVFG